MERHTPWMRAAAAALWLSTGWPSAGTSQPLKVVIQSGHLAEIRDVTYSPDGCYIATAGADDRVKLWDETTGQEIRTFRAGRSPHRSVAFSRGGRNLLIGLEQGPASEWRVADGARVREYTADVSSSAALDADGRLVAVTGGERFGPDRGVTLWNATTAERVGTYAWYGANKPDAPQISADDRELDHKPNTVALGPHGEYFATTGDEGRTALWKVGTPAPLRFYGHGSALEDDTDFWREMGRVAHMAVAFSPDGRYLAGAIGTVGYLWPVDTANRVVTLQGQQSAITEIAFSGDGTLVATGSTSGEVTVWQAATGRRLTSFAAQQGAVHAIEFKPREEGVRCEAQLPEAGGLLNGRILVTSGADSTARIWSLSDARLIRALSPKVQPLNDVAFSPDGTRLALASSAAPHGSVKLWDLTSGFDVTAFPHIEGGVNALAYSPDGRLLATAGPQTGTILWDAHSLTSLEVFAPPEQPRWREIFGNTIGVLLLSTNRGMALLGNSSLSSALTTTKFSANEGARALAFDPSGRFLAMGGNQDTAVWDVRDRRLVNDDLGDKLIDELAYTPDGKIIVSAGGRANARDAATGKRIARYARRFFGPRNSPISVAVHPGGKSVALGSRGGRIDIRELESGDELQQYEAGADVHTLKFSRDGRLLVAGDGGGRVLVFDAEHGLQLLRTLEAHTDTVFAAAFSPDGKMLATASADGTARLWNTATWEEIVAFVSIGSDDYVILTPDNHYAASTNGNYGIAFRRGGVMFPFEQFDLQLNRPDLVFTRLGTVDPALIDAYRDAYRRRLERMNIDETAWQDDSSPPEVAIRDLPKRLATSERRLEFTVAAEDDASAIRALNVWVNDVPLYGSAGLVLEGNARAVQRRVAIELSEGRNKVQVSAIDERGFESVRATIETVYTPPVGAKHDLYLVSVGVSDYGDDRMNLTYAAKDAGDLARAFSAQERFGQIHAFTILDRDATRETILGVKDELLRSSVDDEVVLFVAGHGLLDGDLNYFFATADIDFAHPAARGLSYDDLEGLLDGIPARRKLLLMDTCFSGEVDRRAANDDSAASASASVAEGVVVHAVRGIQVVDDGPQVSTTDSFRLMQKVFANLGRGSGAVVISAAGGNEYAFEGRSSANGVFTHSVIEAVSNTPDDAYLRLSQLREYVVTRVRTLTAGWQTPSVRRVNLDFDYPVFSREEPRIQNIPEIESRDFGKLLIRTAEQGVSTQPQGD